MNVHAAGRVQPHHLVRHPHRPDDRSSSAGPETGPVATSSPDAGSTAAQGTVDGADGDTTGPATPGGNDTPFTHALHRGQGRKLGILRRMPSVDDVAAEQAAAGLGPTDASDTTGVDGLTPVDDATTTDDTSPADGTPPASTEPDVIDSTTGTDGAAGGDGTIAIDGTSLVDDVLGGDAPVDSVVESGIELIEQLRERLEDARVDEPGRLPVEGPDATEV